MVDVGLGDPEAREHREVELGQDPPDRPDRPAPVSRAIVGLAHGISHALQGLGHVVRLASQRLDQNEPDGQAVGYVGDATDGLAERVLGGAVGDVHRQPRHHRAARHRRSSSGVGAVSIGGGQRRGHHPDRLQGDPIPDRRVDLGHHAGNGLGQGVDPGVGRHRRGHRVGEQRIDERDLGPKVGVGDAGFATSGGVGDHRAARDLRPGAGAGGHGDERDLGRWVGGALGQELGETHTELGAQSSRLGRVDDRAAADGHQHLGARVDERSRGLIDHVDGGLRGWLVEPGDAEPLAAGELGEKGGDRRVVLLDALVDHQEDGARTELGHDCGQLVGNALTEADLDRQVVVERGDRLHGALLHTGPRQLFAL